MVEPAEPPSRAAEALFSHGHLLPLRLPPRLQAVKHLRTSNVSSCSDSSLSSSKPTTPLSHQPHRRSPSLSLPSPRSQGPYPRRAISPRTLPLRPLHRRAVKMRNMPTAAHSRMTTCSQTWPRRRRDRVRIRRASCSLGERC